MQLYTSNIPDSISQWVRQSEQVEDNCNVDSLNYLPGEMGFSWLFCDQVATQAACLLPERTCQ